MGEFLVLDDYDVNGFVVSLYYINIFTFLDFFEFQEFVGDVADLVRMRADGLPPTSNAQQSHKVLLVCPFLSFLDFKPLPSKLFIPPTCRKCLNSCSFQVVVFKRL